MVIIYRPIEQLQILAMTTGIPYSVQQQLEIGLILLCGTRYFEKVFGEWNEKASEDRTWAAFKSNFKNIQAKVIEIHQPTMQ